MKKLIGILALLALVNTANAELLKNFKWDGKIEVNAATTMNTLDANSKAKDTTSDVDARVQLNAGFDLTEDVNAVVSAVKCNRQYGDASQTAAGATIDAFTFEQAYLNLKGVLGIDHKVGRQYYGDEGSIVIYYGPRGWPYSRTNAGAALTAPGNPLSVSGVDGWTGWYKNDKLAIHAIVAKIANSNNPAAAAARTADTDTNLAGVVGKYDLMEILNLGAYIYEQKMAKASDADSTLDVVGVKGNGKFMGFDYYGEVAKNYGAYHTGTSTQTYTGTAFIVGAKYGLDLIGKWTFMGEMGVGSGDKASVKKNETFTGVNTDYRPGIVFGGVEGNNGLGNLTTWNLGANWNTPMFEKLTLGGKLYHFSYTEKVSKTIAGPTTFTTDTIGNELDLTASWQHSENVNLTGYYGAFMPTGKYTKYVLGSATAKNDMATVFGAALNVKF